MSVSTVVAVRSAVTKGVCSAADAVDAHVDNRHGCRAYSVSLAAA
jgi:hypothetical protein